MSAQKQFAWKDECMVCCKDMFTATFKTKVFFSLNWGYIWPTMCSYIFEEMPHLVINFGIRIININVAEFSQFISNGKSSAALTKIILIPFEER